MNELEPSAWSILRAEYLIDDRYLRVRSETVELPNGEVREPYYVIQQSHWVSVFCVTDDGRVLINRQYKHGIGEIVAELPAGAIDPGETPEQAARRELLEETGYLAEDYELVGEFIVEPTSHDARCSVFLATGARRVQEPEADPSEVIVVEAVTPEALLDLVRQGEIRVLAHVSFIYRCLDHLGHFSRGA